MDRQSRRRLLQSTLTLASLGLFSACGALLPQEQSPRVARLGWLMPNALNSPPDADITRGFQQGLQELGYVEGQNLVIEYRAAEGNFDRLPGLAAELARLPLDVVFAQSTPGGVAAKNAITDIPVVIVATDPVGRGLIASLSHPGGNVTGLTVSFPGLYGKKLELLKEAVPHVRRVAYLMSPSMPAAWISEMTAAAQTLGLELQTLRTARADEFERAFTEMSEKGVEALDVGADPVYQDNRWRIAELALRGRLPSIGESGLYAQAGCLMGHGPSYPDLYRRAATYVDKILKGAKPGDLPVEQPTKFEFIINVKTAETLGLTIPQSVLIQATETIQ